jgi:hypothetical protein
MLRIRVTRPDGTTTETGPREIIATIGDLYFDLIAQGKIQVYYDGCRTVWTYEMLPSTGPARLKAFREAR